MRGLLFRLLFVAIAPFVGAAQAFAAAGTIDALEGDVRLMNARGITAAKEGAAIDEGDTIVTGANAWALLVMSDGASLTIRPESRVRIDTYRYKPDTPAENAGAISLLKGAFRSITGAIGQTNRDAYRVTSPTATIGIRGTDHEPAYFPPGAQRANEEPGTYDKVNQGESYIRTQKGQVSVRPGQTAFVHHDARVAPRLLARAPAFYQRHAEIDKRAAPRREEFHRRVKEERAKNGEKGEKGHKGDPDRAEQREHDKKTREETQAERREARQKAAEERRQQRAHEHEAKKRERHEKKGHRE